MATDDEQLLNTIRGALIDAADVINDGPLPSGWSTIVAARIAGAIDASHHGGETPTISTPAEPHRLTTVERRST